MTEDGRYYNNDPFPKTPIELVNDIAITHGAVRLYAHLAWRYNGNRLRNPPGQKSIGDVLGVSRTTIQTWLKELAAKDWIVVEHRGKIENGDFESNYYHVFADPNDCRVFRETFADPKRLAARPAVQGRKLRTGVGGLIDPQYRANSTEHARANSTEHARANSTEHARAKLNWQNQDSDSRDDSMRFFLWATAQKLNISQGLSIKGIEAEIHAEYARLGQAAFRAVVERCIERRGKTWNYYLKALRAQTPLTPNTPFSAPPPLPPVVDFRQVKMHWDGETQTWDDPRFVYIGRAVTRHYNLPRSPFANTAVVNAKRTPQQAVAAFRDHALKNIVILKGISALRGKVLVCWCKGTGQEDAPCHGEVLLELAALPDDALNDLIARAEAGEAEKSARADDAHVIDELIKAWLSASQTIMPNAYGNKTMRTQALEMQRRCITPAIIEAYIDHKRLQPYWKDRAIEWWRLCAEIVPFAAGRDFIPRARIEHREAGITHDADWRGLLVSVPLDQES